MADNQFKQIIFSNIALSDMLEELNKRSAKRYLDVESMIEELRALIKTPTDALLLIPLIKDYLGRSIENDDVLIKVCSIIQKALAKEASLGSVGGPIDTYFSEADWKELQESKIPDDLKIQLKIPENADTKVR